MRLFALFSKARNKTPDSTVAKRALTAHDVKKLDELKLEADEAGGLLASAIADPEATQSERSESLLAYAYRIIDLLEFVQKCERECGLEKKLPEVPELVNLTQEQKLEVVGELIGRVMARGSSGKTNDTL